MSVSSPASLSHPATEAGSPTGHPCPRCAAEVPGGENACLICGFDLPACARQFRFDPPPLELLMDPTGCVPMEQRDAIHAQRDTLVTRFPQLDFSFCLVPLKDDQDLAEFSFWLFNSAPDADESRAWRILIAIDLHAGEVVLTPGYAIERFLDPVGWTEALRTLSDHGSGRRWSNGIGDFLDCARRLLDKADAEWGNSEAPADEPSPDNPR